VVFTSREHVITLEPRRKGLLGMTLRYPYEVRDEKDYFDAISDEKIHADMLELAHRIVESKSGQFMPQTFEDRYEPALRELLQKKQGDQPTRGPEWWEPARVVNLMDALRRIVEASRAGAKPPAPSVVRSPKAQTLPKRTITIRSAQHKKNGPARRAASFC
jgi:DNA end-binding protein Ku